MTSLRSSDPTYDLLLSYQYYSSQYLNQVVNAARMVKFKTLLVFINILDITMKEHNFNETDPISFPIPGNFQQKTSRSTQEDCQPHFHDAEMYTMKQP